MKRLPSLISSNRGSHNCICRITLDFTEKILNTHALIKKIPEKFLPQRKSFVPATPRGKKIEVKTSLRVELVGELLAARKNRVEELLIGKRAFSYFL